MRAVRNETVASCEITDGGGDWEFCDDAAIARRSDDGACTEPEADVNADCVADETDCRQVLHDSS